MANAWKKREPSPFLSPKFLFFSLLAVSILFFYLFFSHSRYLSLPTPNVSLSFFPIKSLQPFNCFTCPQASPVFASLVEGVAHPFLYSLADFGSLPEKPHKNIARMLKGKPFRRPDISATIQGLLTKKNPGDGIVVDVGANVGMATFAAAAMGFHVVAFEPVFENLQRICDGVFLNRAIDKVTVFSAAASDRIGNITFHKLIGRLDNSAVSATGARLAFKSNEEIAVNVATIPLDEVIPDTQRVLLLKIDVQGWEYHVLKGASKLLSRKRDDAPYVIYEEDERLLKESNSSAREIREFLGSVGYRQCKMHGSDAHCTKD